jgi:hypothetical protein
MAGNKTVRLRKFGAALPLLLIVLALFLAPGAALAQSAKPAASAASVAGQAAGAATAASPTAAASPGQAAAPSANPSAAAAPAPAGVATPVGANAPKQTEEPTSLFAYLLIALAVVWFLGAIGGIARILTRPRGLYPQPLPATESDRVFLSFLMPFVALLTVIVILVAFGVLFLWLASISPRSFDTEVYPFAVDLFIICFVMFVATMLALRDGGKKPSAVH